MIIRMNEDENTIAAEGMVAVLILPWNSLGEIARGRADQQTEENASCQILRRRRNRNRGPALTPFRRGRILCHMPLLEVQRPQNLFPYPGRRGARGRWDFFRRRTKRGRRSGIVGESGSGKVRGLLFASAADSAAAREDRGRQGLVRWQRSPGAQSQDEIRSSPGKADRDDLPGPHDLAQSLPEDLESTDGAASASSRHWEQDGGSRAGRSRSSMPSEFPTRNPENRQLPPRVFRGNATAGHDRHGHDRPAGPASSRMNRPPRWT